VLGGVGGDIIAAPGGTNIIFGDNGEVNLNNAAGSNDVFTTNPDLGGADQITGGTGNNLILGGAGNDEIVGGVGNDIIFGDNGYVTRNNVNLILSIALLAGVQVGGDDTIDGGGGNDIINGNVGNDTIEAGAGDDTIIADEGFGIDTATDSSGILTIDFRTVTSDITGYSNVVASQFNVADGSQLTVGPALVNFLYLGSGDDEIVFTQVESRTIVVTDEEGDDVYDVTLSDASAVTNFTISDTEGSTDTVLARFNSTAAIALNHIDITYGNEVINFSVEIDREVIIDVGTLTTLTNTDNGGVSDLVNRLLSVTANTLTVDAEVQAHNIIFTTVGEVNVKHDLNARNNGDITITTSGVAGNINIYTELYVSSGITKIGDGAGFMDIISKDGLIQLLDASDTDVDFRAAASALAASARGFNKPLVTAVATLTASTTGNVAGADIVIRETNDLQIIGRDLTVDNVLNVTGVVSDFGNIEITLLAIDARLTLASGNIKTNSPDRDITLFVDDLDIFSGANTISGSGVLVLQANSPVWHYRLGTAAETVAGADVARATFAAALELSTRDLAALADGFSQITIGRPATGNTTIFGDASFRDKAIFYSEIITVAGDVQIAADAAEFYARLLEVKREDLHHLDGTLASGITALTLLFEIDEQMVVSGWVTGMDRVTINVDATTGVDNLVDYAGELNGLSSAPGSWIETFRANSTMTITTSKSIRIAGLLQVGGALSDEAIIHTLTIAAGSNVVTADSGLMRAETVGMVVAGYADINTDFEKLTALIALNLTVDELDRITLVDVATTAGAIVITADDILATRVRSLTDAVAASITMTADNGAIVIDRIAAGRMNGLITLTASGNIVEIDPDDTDFDVIAHAITMTASGKVGIGANSDNNLEIDGDTLAAYAVIGIFVDTRIEELIAINSGIGDIDVREIDSIRLMDVSAADGAVLVRAQDSIDAVSVRSLTDAIGRNVGLVSATGNINVGYIAAGLTKGSITLDAQDRLGRILELTAVDTEVDAQAWLGLLSAGDAIGSAVAPELNLETAFTFAFNNLAEDEVDLETTGDLQLILSFAGEITITTTGDIDVNYLNSNGHDIVLTSNSGGVSIDAILGEAGDIIINARDLIDLNAVTFTGEPGHIVTTGEVSIISKNDAVMINGSIISNGNIELQAHTTVEVNGALESLYGSIIISSPEIAIITPVIASEDIIVTAGGRLETTAAGTLTAGRNVTLTTTSSTTGDMVVAGAVDAGDYVKLTAAAEMILDGDVTAGRDITLIGKNDMIVTGDLTAGGKVTMTATKNLTVTGDIDSGNTVLLDMQWTSGILTVNGSVTAGADITLKSKNEIVIDGNITGAKKLTITAGANSAITVGTVAAPVNLTAGLTLSLTSFKSLTIFGNLSSTIADVKATGSSTGMDMTIVGDITAGTTISLTTGEALTVTGTILAKNQVTLKTTKTTTGNIVVAGAITSLTNTVTLDAKAGLTMDSAITAKTVSLKAVLAMVISGNIMSTTTVTITGSKAVTITAASVITAGSTINVTAADTLTIAGAIDGEGTVTLTMSNTSRGTEISGTVVAKGKLTVTSKGNLTLTSGVTRSLLQSETSDVIINGSGTGKSAQITGDILAGGNLTITKLEEIRIEGDVIVTKQVSLTTTQAGAGITVIGSITTTTGKVILNSKAGINVTGSIISGHDITMTTAGTSLLYVTGSLTALGAGRDIILTASRNLTLDNVDIWLDDKLTLKYPSAGILTKINSTRNGVAL
jgi:hypothetical protein